LKNCKYNAFLDGEFDEEKNRREFQEALQAVRNKVDSPMKQMRVVTLSKKISCWHCYKLFSEDAEEKQRVYEKDFCSKECVRAFKH